MTSQEQTFPQKLEALVKAFVVAERPGETDAEVAVAVLEKLDPLQPSTNFEPSS